MSDTTLAFDFGTSNSAVALLEGGTVRRIPVEAGEDTLPTAVFFPEDGGAMRIGRAAAEALIAGEPGRYMRALKSILGTELFHQTRLIEGRRRTLEEIVTAFIAEVKARAEAATGRRFDAVLSGRPVRFHSSDAARDAQAARDLEACYRAAGFTAVDFLPEPEAAARASRAATEETGLIVDIGGGTSDFSLYRSAPDRLEIRASHGIRLGGTDFDQRISITHVMPLLGRGGQLRRTFGEGLLPVPNAIYDDLATWPRIPFLYTRDTARAVAEMEALAVDARAMARLARVIEDELGHGIAFAVERGKIAANGGASAGIALSEVERGLSAPIDAGTMTEALDEMRAPLSEAILRTLEAADCAPDAVDAAVLVGGSSLMRIVQDEVARCLPSARMREAQAFTAVIDGLALSLGG